MQYSSLYIRPTVTSTHMCMAINALNKHNSHTVISLYIGASVSWTLMHNRFHIYRKIHSQYAYCVFIMSLCHSWTHLCLKNATQLPRLLNMFAKHRNNVILQWQKNKPRDKLKHINPQKSSCPSTGAGNGSGIKKSVMISDLNLFLVVKKNTSESIKTKTSVSDRL